jgi:hypothetical protein
MHSISPQSRKFGWRMLPAVFVLTALSSLCQAEIGWDCCGCRCTWCAWSRTWHEPTALYNPLRPYYVPRPAAICGCNGFGPAGCYDGAYGCNGCAGSGETAGCHSSDYAMLEEEMPAMYGRAKPDSCLGAPPCGMERLGQIPNDLAVTAGGGGAASAPVAGR